VSQKEDELVQQKGDWSKHDNKKYIGKIDRVFVALSEPWEVEYYIDHYLETRKYPVNNKSRNIVAADLENAPGRAPHKREDLDTYLDRVYASRKT
jgi:hypothetical protein